MAPSSDWVRALWSLFWHKGDSGHLSAGWWPRPQGATAQDPSEGAAQSSCPAPLPGWRPGSCPRRLLLLFWDLPGSRLSPLCCSPV